MKKCFNLALYYALAAMVGGVFYREYTKFAGFTGVTTLSVVHTHLFMLGMVMFLVVGLLCDRLPLAGEKQFRRFLTLYNIGVPLTAIMLFVRGLTQVMALPLSRGADAAISGIAGIGHILAGVGIVFLLLCLRRVAGAREGQGAAQAL